MKVTMKPPTPPPPRKAPPPDAKDPAGKAQAPKAGATDAARPNAAQDAPKSNADVVAEVFAEALAEPDALVKEQKAIADREARMREALRFQGRLPKRS
jgi:hypothetical protein